MEPPQNPGGFRPQLGAHGWRHRDCHLRRQHPGLQGASGPARSHRTGERQPIHVRTYGRQNAGAKRRIPPPANDEGLGLELILLSVPDD